MSKEHKQIPSNGAKRYHVQDYVRWSDCDTAGFILWSAYTRFIEIAETEFFRGMGYPYKVLFDHLNIWLPRVQLHFDYKTPALLDELLDVEVWVGRIGNTSIRLEFDILKPDGEIAMEAYLVMVTTTREWPPTPIPVPQELREAMAPYRADLISESKAE
jgi:acyl-CoA thioester hydrolase